MKKSFTETDTVTSNEGLVRLRIYDGLLPVEDAYKELYELERSQHEAVWRRYLDYSSAAEKRMAAMAGRIRSLEIAAAGIRQ